MKYHSLIFIGDHGNTREIAKINDLDKAGHPKSDSDILEDANLLICAFCAEHNFKIYYTRLWNQNNITIFDVGSHSEFFHLVPAIDFRHHGGES
jgi:hypothetical protein